MKPDAKGSYEQRRKVVLGRTIGQYALAVSRHGTKQPGPDYAVCHPEADPLVWHTLSLSGIRYVLHPFRMPFHMASLYKNYLLFDLPPDSDLTAIRLQGLMEQVAEEPATTKLQSYEWDRFAYAAEISAAEAKEWGLPPEMKPFQEEFDPVIADRLGYPGVPLLPISASQDIYGHHTSIYAECAIPWDAAVKML